MKVLVTCEHGGNKIPPEYATAFKQARRILSSHRGYDIGALDLFNRFSQIADFSLVSTTSRLVVELNRSLLHPKLFSEFMQPLSTAQAEQVLLEHYYPYREKILKQVTEWVGQGFQVLHLSVHSFAPELNGKVRKADLGLLYDPKREREQFFAARWRQQLQLVQPAIKIRYNYPTKGTSDGFLTQLRRSFPKAQYAGVELEVNQKFPEGVPEEWSALQEHLTNSFNKAI
nr:N-formylglutamate amidohydrolase [Rufibacter sp. XAAS-G3-1]